MVNLDLKRINSHSPYHVTASRDKHSFRFVTDFGVDYSISFLEDELLTSDDTYQFIIANTNDKKSPRDSKLRKAIISIIYEFFEASNTTLLYICETGDSKQSMRNRLFEFWFKFVKLSLVTLSFANAVDIDNETNNIKVKTIISLYFSFYSSIN